MSKQGPYWRFPSNLAAAEQLSRICGYNEPERVNVQSAELKVDAALLEQLRAGYVNLGERERGNGAPTKVTRVVEYRGCTASCLRNCASNFVASDTTHVSMTRRRQKDQHS
jgi:hypothetical protein